MIGTDINSIKTARTPTGQITVVGYKNCKERSTIREKEN